MNILSKLKSHEHLSHNEKTLREYILMHPNDVLDMDAKELSLACFVSTSTIYRLCEKLGVGGYAELKVKIAGAIKEFSNNDDVFDYDFPIKESQTHHEILNSLKEDYEQTLNATYNFFDLDQLKKITAALKKAKHIDIYTSAGNIYFAENFVFQMREIGVHVNLPIEEYNQSLSIAQSDETHLAIVISFEGRGFLIDATISSLQERKTPILLISTRKYLSKKNNINYHLSLCPYENHYKKVSSFSTRFSLLYILDALYSCYFALDYNENIDKKMKYYDTISSLRKNGIKKN